MIKDVHRISSCLAVGSFHVNLAMQGCFYGRTGQGCLFVRFYQNIDYYFLCWTDTWKPTFFCFLSFLLGEVAYCVSFEILKKNANIYIHTYIYTRLITRALCVFFYLFIFRSIYLFFFLVLKCLKVIYK